MCRAYAISLRWFRVVAGPPLINGDEAIFLKNVTATKDQANHIKLCWEWCDDATLTPFVLRREGVVIDTLSYAARSYYDYTAPKGVNVEYSIETPGIDGALNYQLVYTVGRMPSMKTVLGRVYQVHSHCGLANKTVRISHWRIPIWDQINLSAEREQIHPDFIKLPICRYR